MPFYVGDYLRDTGHLTTCEHGAYFLLLCHAWTHDGVLPNDEVRLLNIAKMDNRAWRRSSATLKAFFYVDGDTLRHRRIDRELAKSKDISNQRRAAGKASAVQREAQQKTNKRSTSVDLPVDFPLQQTGRQEQEQEQEQERIPSNSREAGTNPRALGTNPRATGTNPRAATAPARSAPLEGEFEIFWKLYPRKQEGPAACRKEWAKALKAASPEEVISGLRRYPFKPDFLPMAATWLNQKRWLTQANTPPPLVLNDHDPTFSPGQL